MAGLNTQLQDYLSKSKKTSLNNTSQNTQNYFNFFNKSAEPTAVDDTTNGWFNQAQKDPLLPSLVRNFQWQWTRHIIHRQYDTVQD